MKPLYHAAWVIAAMQARQAVAHPYAASAPLSDAAALYDLYEAGELDDVELQRLLSLCDAPLDINDATVDELLDLPHITHRIAEAVVIARTGSGGFTDTSEFTKILGLHDSQLADILPFITLHPPPQTHGDAKHSDNSGRLRSGTVFAGQLGQDLRSQEYAPRRPEIYLIAEAQLRKNYGAGFYLTRRPLLHPVSPLSVCLL
ncbi:MAG: helix-hairpin-helix domain-containing protein [Myxococcota bacterium]